MDTYTGNLNVAEELPEEEATEKNFYIIVGAIALVGFIMLLR